MAEKVLWKTGDTITADKLNASGVYVILLEEVEDGDTVKTTSTATSGEVFAALEAGKLVVGIMHWRDSETEEGYLIYLLCSADRSLGSFEFTNGGSGLVMYGEYPDGTLATGNGQE